MSDLQVKLYLKSGRETRNISNAVSYSVFTGRAVLIDQNTFPREIKSKSVREDFLTRILFELEFLISYEKIGLQTYLFTRSGKRTTDLIKASAFSIYLNRKIIFNKRQIPSSLKTELAREKYIAKFLFEVELLLKLDAEAKKSEDKDSFEKNLKNDAPDIANAKREHITYGESIVSPLRAEVITDNSNLYSSYVDYRLYRNARNDIYDKATAIIYNVVFNEPIQVTNDNHDKIDKVRNLFFIFIKNFFENMAAKGVKGKHVYTRLVLKDVRGQDSGLGVSRHGISTSPMEAVRRSVSKFDEMLDFEKDNSFRGYLMSTHLLDKEGGVTKSGEVRSSVTGIQVVWYMGYHDEDYSEENLTKEEMSRVFAKTRTRKK